MFHNDDVYLFLATESRRGLIAGMGLLGFVGLG